METDDFVTQFGEAVEKFHRQMDAHGSAYPLTRNVLVAKYKLSNRKLNEFIVKNDIKIIKKDGKETIRVPATLHHTFLRYHRDGECAALAIQNISRNTVVAMVGCYDALIGDMVRIIFHAKPEILKAYGVSIAASDIFAFSSIKDVEDHLINKQVESVLRGSHEEQLEWFENKLGIKTCKSFSHFPDFIEITERRNLFVHTEGKVSQSYVAKCNKAGLEVAVNIGDILYATSQYIQKSYDVLMETGIKLSQVVWRKFNLGIDTCDEILQDITFDCLTSHQYKLAQELLDFATNDVKKYSSEEFGWVFRVNHALSYYLAGDLEKATTMVKSHDWSALDIKYRLAEAVLLENNEEARSLMLQMGPNKDFQTYYQQWPLFRKFRQAIIFKTTYKEIYHSDFSYQEQRDASWKEFLAEAQAILNEDNK